MKRIEGAKHLLAGLLCGLLLFSASASSRAGDQAAANALFVEVVRLADEATAAPPAQAEPSI